MFPSYRGYMPSVDLGPEDIRKVTGISYTSFGPLTNVCLLRCKVCMENQEVPMLEENRSHFNSRIFSEFTLLSSTIWPGELTEWQNNKQETSQKLQLLLFSLTMCITVEAGHGREKSLEKRKMYTTEWRYKSRLCIYFLLPSTEELTCSNMISQKNADHDIQE